VRDFVIASREFHPFGGGGIGTYLNALARTLHGAWRVTVITTSAHQRRYDDLVGSADDRLPPHSRFVFVDDPEQAGSYFGSTHAWSARIYAEIKRQFPAGGPDVVEFQDFLGEGAVTCQANAVGDPALANTRVCVRISTTSELCSVLDGRVGRDWHESQVAEIERLSLRYADCLLWAGGDILDGYRRYYGPANLSPAVQVRHPLYVEGDPPACAGHTDATSGPLRLLYFGRLQRLKGVQNLLRALTGLDDDWRLTLVGSDTATAPLGGSMRQQLELMAAGDPRITFQEAIDRREVRSLIRAHHVTVVPSLWESWPAVALESLAHDRPVLAAPTGGLTEIVRPGHSGWFADATDEHALAMAVDHLLKHRVEVAELIASGRPRRHALTLTDPVLVRGGYERIAERPKRFPAPMREHRRPSPLVSVVIPYYRLSGFVQDAVRSVFNQTHRKLEVILVNDGSFWPEDQIIAELAVRYPMRVLSQPHSGLSTARNAGISQARGKYVFPMDADNVAEPEFVSRCVSVLEADPRLAYVTTWSRFIDEDGVADLAPSGGIQPLGNTSRILPHINAAGDAAAVLPRRLFQLGYRYSPDLSSNEDWALYRQLAQDGRFGRVIPERLMRYRIRPGSMTRTVAAPHLTRLIEEIDAHMIEAAVNGRR